MLKIELSRMMEELGYARGQKVTIKEIHEETGIHRKILSRIINHPEIPTGSEHIEKLVEFFFVRFRKVRNDQAHSSAVKLDGEMDFLSSLSLWPKMLLGTQGRIWRENPMGVDEALIRWIAFELLQFFPDGSAFIDPIKRQVRGEPRQLDTNLLWHLYESSRNKAPVSK